MGSGAISDSVYRQLDEGVGDRVAQRHPGTRDSVARPVKSEWAEKVITKD